jgi:pyruvate/2-oxoglutarate dehydrogenase complex dihydrolipoamide dehydrogenase (E3) component
MTTENCRNLVIGSGVGGKVLAWNLAQRGETTVVIERSMIGGSCPNVACLPSKNVIYSAKMVALAQPKTGLGVLGGDIHVDMSGVVRRKRQMVQELVEIHLNLYRSTGAELVMGEARFIEHKTVEVNLNAGGSRRVRGERVFLSLGTRAMIPDVVGLAAAEPLTHVEALNLDRVPEHLVVLAMGR